MSNNGGCDELSEGCTNTIGSRECYCLNGYQRNGENCIGKIRSFFFFFFFFLFENINNESNKIVDVNECLTNNGGCDINAICSNTIGSFNCICKPEYSGDGLSCYGNILFFFSESLIFNH